MALIDTEVEVFPPDPARFWGWHLDRPQPGGRLAGSRVEVLGWLLARDARLKWVELEVDGAVVERVSPDQPRPDIVTAFPAAEHALMCGFRGTVPVLRAGMAESVARVRAVLGDGSRVDLAAIRARRCWQECPDPASGPLVTVVVHAPPGSGLELHASLASIMAQSHPHLEVAVVHTGTVEADAGLVARHPWIRWIFAGAVDPADARNAALQRTLGDFVTFVAAGARLSRGAIAAGLQALQTHPDAAAVAGGDAAGAATETEPAPAFDPERAEVALFRRSVFSAVGAFSPGPAESLDQDHLRRIAEGYLVVWVGGLALERPVAS